ncbi:MAG: hypothetical protein KatS3mg010_1556 [Acidimicrobiia bacterium]|nr:MAG: hypothetical protein KatS3mg010_1556 [Acidimicrobiia bacterium]
MFQANLDPSGYGWRFDAQSPGGHLFDDVMHKYAMALWLVDADVRSVQAVVRNGPLFFEAPTVALWEYDRGDLLGLMEVSYAPDMFIRSSHYGADEFFEIQGTSGFVWVTRLCGQLHDLPPVVLYEEDGRRTSFADLDASYDGSFRRAAATSWTRSSTARRRPRTGHGDQGAAARVRRVPGVERAPSRRPFHDRLRGLARGLAARPREADARRGARCSPARRLAAPASGGQARNVVA